MKSIEHNEADQPHSDAPSLMAFSLGALLGASISVVIARSRQIRAALRGLRHPALSEQEVGSIGTRSASEAMASPETKTQGFTASPAVLPPAPVAQGSTRGTRTVVVPAPVAGVIERRWSAPTRYIMGVFLFLAMLVVLFVGRSAIPMVVAAMLLAVFVDPLIKFLMRRLRMKNGLAVGLTYLIVIALLLLVPVLAIPSIVNAVNFVMDIDPQLVAQRLLQTIDSLATSLQGNPTLAAIFTPILDTLETTVIDYAATAQGGIPAISLSVDDIISRSGQALGALTRFLGPTLSVLASIFITLLISLQMTLSADEMRNWYADLIPPGHGPELSALITKIRLTWTGFLRGQMTLMLVIGMVTWLGGVILGLPQALFLGIIAGVLELIPNIGPTLAAVPAVILALLFGSTHLAVSNLVFALIVIAFYVLVQFIENQFLVPNIMGDAVNLPPLVVLIGTIAGAGAFGIMGALLATPVIATGNLVFRYVYRKIMEDQPAPPPVEEEPGLWEKVKGAATSLTQRISRRKKPAAIKSK